MKQYLITYGPLLPPKLKYVLLCAYKYIRGAFKLICVSGLSTGYRLNEKTAFFSICNAFFRTPSQPEWRAHNELRNRLEAHFGERNWGVEYPEENLETAFERNLCELDFNVLEFEGPTDQCKLRGPLMWSTELIVKKFDGAVADAAAMLAYDTAMHINVPRTDFLKHWINPDITNTYNRDQPSP